MYETELGKLYHGDARDAVSILKEDSIDLIFTDPPYPRQYFYCYEQLAWIFPHFMKVGASLFTIVGHYALEQVMGVFFSHLKYRWIFNLDQEEDSHSRMGMGIEVVWKPMLWYVKEKFPKERNYGFMRDKIIIPKKDKSLHEWQQSLAWGYDIIRKVTKEGELVCDPFVGSGTIPIICEHLGRKWVAIDIDEKAIETTIGRLKSYESRCAV